MQKYIQKHISKYYNLFNNIYMAGPAFDHYLGNVRKNKASDYTKKVMSGLYIPTDNWPYLYVKSRGISAFYMSLIVAIILISLLLIMISSGDIRRSIISGKRIDIPMFLFGFAFLLLETRYVTQIMLCVKRRKIYDHITTRRRNSVVYY